MVIFRDSEGRPGYHQADRLEDAVRFVEELRNEQHVTDTRLFAMHEIAIEFRTYWKAEVVTDPVTTDDDHHAVPVVPREEPVAVAAAPFAVPAVAAPVPSGGRFGLFGR